VIIFRSFSAVTSLTVEGGDLRFGVGVWSGVIFGGYGSEKER